MNRDLSERIMKLPLRSKAQLLWRMVRDPYVPRRAKAVLPVVLLYLAFPLDVIPDFIPVLGQLDDLLVVALGLGLFIALTPREVIEFHLREFE
ncbi:MAG TPA: DUF1232 domain-containing protein [Dehalococcoidia bacterium]|nr:DUF1232 domain-containing protein [Dehalococcoidia bacterium]